MRPFMIEVSLFEFSSRVSHDGTLALSSVHVGWRLGVLLRLRARLLAASSCVNLECAAFRARLLAASSCSTSILAL